MRGLGLVLYGVEGIGKTTLALEFPKPLGIINIRETGYDDLKDVGKVPSGTMPLICSNWEDVLVAVKACQQKTLVIDSLSGLQEYLIKYVTKTVYGGNYAAFKSFYNGLRQDCPVQMMELIDLFEFKRAQGTHIILIAHRKTEAEPNSDGPDIMMQTLFGDIGITGPIMKWAQAILFMTGKKNVDIVTESAGKGDNVKILEGKSTGVPTRIMYTSFSGAHAAKNKLELPPLVMMGKTSLEGYTNFVAALPELVRKNLVSAPK